MPRVPMDHPLRVPAISPVERSKGFRRRCGPSSCSARCNCRSGRHWRHGRQAASCAGPDRDGPAIMTPSPTVPELRLALRRFLIA